MKQTTTPNFDHSDGSDDPALPSAVVPTLTPGAHKQELRRELLQEFQHFRRGTDPGAVSHGARAPWLTRLGYKLAVAAALAIAVGIAAVVYFTSGSSRLAHDSGSTTRHLTAAIGGGGANRKLAPDDIQIADAIESGHFKLEQVVTSRFGGRVYLYRVKLTDAREVLFASDHVMPDDPVMHLRYAQELQQRIETDGGKFVPERTRDNPPGDAATAAGAPRVYRYRIDLSDGMSEVYASDREPDLAKRQLHQAELQQAMDQLRGEVSKTIAGPDGAAVYLVKVALSDGTIRVYASSEAPRAK